MDDELSETVKFRVTKRQLFRFEQAASHEGLTKSEYLRQRMLIADNLADELKALRALFVDLQDKKERENTLACSIETLLILRSISEPKVLRSVHASMKGMGVEPISAT